MYGIPTWVYVPSGLIAVFLVVLPFLVPDPSINGFCMVAVIPFTVIAAAGVFERLGWL
jgi:hypothetical protein